MTGSELATSGADGAGPGRDWSVEAVARTAADTRDLAARLAEACRAGDVVLLVGGLGAGKTTFAQGFARGLGVEGPVTSPTFTLVRQYGCAEGPSGIEQLVHADVYRLDRMAEVVDLGLTELVEDRAVLLVEWGDAVAPALGESSLTVSLERGADADSAGGVDAGGADSAGGGGDEPRRVVVHGRGPGWASRHREVASAVAGAAG